jgi:hypothetical protein
LETADKACQTCEIAAEEKEDAVTKEQLARDKAFAAAFEIDWNLPSTTATATATSFKVTEKKQDSNIVEIKNDIAQNTHILSHMTSDIKKLLQMMNAVYEFESA